MSDLAVQRFDLDIVRYSKEPKPQKKSFVNLEGHKLGLEVDWEHEEFAFFIYKEKRKKHILCTDRFSFYAGEKEFIRQINLLVSNFYRLVGKDPNLPMYTKMELQIPMAHLNFHVYAKTLRKVVEKEVEYF